jgi:two-component system, CitB family, sensor kinase
VSVADTPQVRRALAAPDPAPLIQPFAEEVRRDSGTDFVVVMGLDRTRYSHPDPAQIGKPFIGDLGTAPQGTPFTQEYTGTLGRSMRAVVPVESDGRVVALVSVGITLQRIQDALADRLPSIGLAAAAILATGVLGAWLISRRLKRQTHGLGEREITRMYEYYEAVLHAVREGLLLVDGEGRVQLLNEEAERLLGLDGSAVGRPVADLGFPDSLTRAVLSSTRRPDEIHLVDDAVLVVNTSPARWQGREVGSVVTLRDHTEIQAVAGELDTVRGLAESLRSQNHEAANRLHTVVSLVELGRTEEALDFATEELEVAQLLTDRVVASVSDPVVSALLLGKTAQAAERGVQLRLGDSTEVTGLPIEQRDAVTILGNLLDNAIDAVGEGPEGAARTVEVQMTGSPSALRLRVGDSGSGLSTEQVTQVFERGWSTKAADGPVGRGLGLALVVQAVRKYDGHIDVGTSPLGGAEFDVRIGAAA